MEGVSWDFGPVIPKRLKEIRSVTSNDCLGIIMPDGNYVPGTICRVIEVLGDKIKMQFVECERSGDNIIDLIVPADWLYDTYEKVFNALPNTKR